MPQNKNSPEPPVMTWGTAMPVLIAAGVFDALRLFFTFFWFFGPALAAAYCAMQTGDTLSSLSLGLLGTKAAVVLCSLGAGALGAAGVELSVPFGVIMADAAGLAGFLTLGLWIVITNRRILKTVENAPLQFAGAFAVGEVPLIGAFPVFTAILWRLYSTQIKVEKAAHAKWEKEQSAAKKDEQTQMNARLIQMQNQSAQIAEANQEAANDAVYAEAANDEIPEQVKKAV